MGVTPMLKLIVGKKGSGKTKLLIEGVNGAAKESKGNVVCIERGMKLRYDLSLQVKLIDIEEYKRFLAFQEVNVSR